MQLVNITMKAILVIPGFCIVTLLAYYLCIYTPLLKNKWPSFSVHSIACQWIQFGQICHTYIRVRDCYNRINPTVCFVVDSLYHEILFFNGRYVWSVCLLVEIVN